MKHSTARDRLTESELVGGGVCLGCGEFVREDEERTCGCPLGYAGVYKECPTCGDVFYNDSPVEECETCVRQQPVTG